MKPFAVLVSVAVVCTFVNVLAAAEDRLGDPLPEGAVQRLGTLRMRYSGGIGDMCYLPDGRGVIAAGRQLEIWDLAKGQIESKHQVGEASPRTVSLRGDGKALLVGDSDAKVHQWDLASARVLRSWDTKQSGLRAAHYSPDAKRMLTTGSNPPTIKEWDLETGQELIAITGKMHYFHEAIYGPDGKTAFVNGGAGSDSILAHYDLTTGELLKDLIKDYYAHYRSLVLSADGERILLGSRHKATEWQLDGYKVLKQFTGHHGHAVTSVAYCANPDELLTGSRDGSIRRWNRHEGKVLLRWWPHNNHVTHIEVSPDGKWALTYGGGVVAECSLETGKPRVEFERHEGPVQCVAFMPGGKQVVSGSTDGTLRVWDITNGATIRVIEGAELGAYAVTVSPDGTKAAAGCKDGKLREFALADGSLVRELSGHRGYVRSVTYTHDGSRLLSSAGDGSICVWEPERAEPVARLEGHRGGVLAISISPDDGRVLSGGRDGTVRLWDLTGGTLVRTLEGHHGWVDAVSFVRGGREAVSAGRDARILHWDLATARLLKAIGNEGPHHALVASQDNSTVYAGGANGVVTGWDLSTGDKPLHFAGHQSPVASLAASPDARRLVSASADTTLLVWGAAND